MRRRHRAEGAAEAHKRQDLKSAIGELHVFAMLLYTFSLAPQAEGASQTPDLKSAIGKLHVFAMLLYTFSLAPQDERASQTPKGRRHIEGAAEAYARKTKLLRYTGLLFQVCNDEPSLAQR